jgi:hypothetical protein
MFLYKNSQLHPRFSQPANDARRTQSHAVSDPHTMGCGLEPVD